MVRGATAGRMRVDAGTDTLSVTDATVSYGGRLPALDQVSVEFARGEVHALLGSNGSGKSTLVKMLSGVIIPSRETRIAVGAMSATHSLTPARSKLAGLRFVHQDLALVPELSVLENLFLSYPYPTRIFTIDWLVARTTAMEALEKVGLALSPRAKVGELSPTEKVLVATARALLGLPSNGGYLFMDEPTAMLDEEHSRQLLSHLRRLADGGEVGIILVTHRLHEVLEFADRATILRDGEVIMRAAHSELSESILFEAVSGVPTQPGLVEKPKRAIVDSPIGFGVNFQLELKDVAGARLQGLSLSVGAGEIVGVAGLGPGKEDAVALIYGMQKPRGGTMTIDGVPYRPKNPGDAVKAGIGLVPGERIPDGGIPELTVGENLLLPHFKRLSSWGRLRRRAFTQSSRQGVEDANVNPPEPKNLFSTLSGGNQQKVIVGRWLDEQRRLVILHEPTAGVDVGARAALYQRIRASARDHGVAFLVVSSDVSELSELCEAVVVLVGGKQVAVLSGQNLSSESISKHCFEIDSKS